MLRRSHKTTTSVDNLHYRKAVEKIDRYQTDTRRLLNN